MRNAPSVVVPTPKKGTRNKKKGLPKRISRPGYQASRARYTSSHRREKNKAARIVRDALRSGDPRRVAVAQARKSRPIRGMDFVLSYVEKELNRKGL